MNLNTLFLICLLSLPFQLSSSSSVESAGLLTGKTFQQTLDQPFSARWEHVALRTILNRIGSVRNLAILLDRRVDPTREMSVSADGEELLRFLDRVAAKNSADVHVVGNTVFIGTGASTGKLRTLVARRQGELLNDSNGHPHRRQLELTRPTTISWDDLTTPTDVLGRIADHFELTIENPQELPHDLWAAALIPEASASELLSLVLIQFDQTFEWADNGTRIRIVPIPQRVIVERRHFPPRDTTPGEALASWRKAIPGVDGTIIGNHILLSGTVEQHEAIERLRRPESISARPTRAAPRPSSLSRERFNLRTNATVSALMKKLSEPGNSQVLFEYDEAELRAAGISLDTRVSFELKNATAEQLLHAMFDPLEIAFELDDRTVRLKVASP